MYRAKSGGACEGIKVMPIFAVCVAALPTGGAGGGGLRLSGIWFRALILPAFGLLHYHVTKPPY